MTFIYVEHVNEIYALDEDSGFATNVGTIEDFEKNPQFTKEEIKFLKEKKWLEK